VNNISAMHVYVPYNTACQRISKELFVLNSTF